MPQQSRAQVTRESIMVAAASEFDRLGYAAVPLSLILERSGVSKGAFYFHFPSKIGLAAAIMEAEQAIWPELTRRWDERGLDALRTLIGSTTQAVELISSDPIVRAGVRLSTDPEVHASGLRPQYLNWESLLTALLERSRDEGLLRAGADPVEVARLLNAVFAGNREIAAALTGYADYVTRMEQAWRVLLPAIATEEWLTDWRTAPGLGG
ncbi:TetR/AcrR family transcriptional regulator [Crossiella sp. SN42]|uniref:ScbR family autoregulator-binding transcription factor n=1 Tax=Crossiella sp. SN42 TaxID=2944808 RepID=UPI00207D693E|nr:ScbR family autoregulator-binding transcription factor [Crossiella sp. SN42]MCO1579358.1 TetR/AcrR family transcriptional regulator [Crossiella sp. SN42]